jgi:cysteine desulfurase/selenocysteine lyase
LQCSVTSSTLFACELGLSATRIFGVSMDLAQPNITEARQFFSATKELAYFNTAAVGLASVALGQAYRSCLEEWESSGFPYVRGEEAGETARSRVAAILGAHHEDIALVPSVSSAAGLVAAQFGQSRGDENVVIGEAEYSSNHFPWLLLERKGYAVRQVPFRNGGLEPEDVERYVDDGTRLIAASAVQTASGHRTDVPAIAQLAKDHGAWLFVDGSQAVGALPLDDVVPCVDFLATADHKFLLHAGRGMGYLYLSEEAQASMTPVSAGWKAGRVPLDSFFGPNMDLSETASRFDHSISWIAAIGNTISLSIFELFGLDAIYERNRQLAESLRATLISIGLPPVELPPRNRSSIVSVPIDGDARKIAGALREKGIVCSARGRHLRLAIHFYNHEDDIERLAAELTAMPV